MSAERCWYEKKTAGVIAFKSRNCNPFIPFPFLRFPYFLLVLLQITAMFTVLLRAKTAFFLFFFIFKFERIECVKDVGCCSSSSNSTIIKLNCDVNY